MTSEELKKYKRNWIRRKRRHTERVFIRLEGTGYHYREEYIEKPQEIEECPFCTMLLNSWHDDHPCERWVILQVWLGSTEIT